MKHISVLILYLLLCHIGRAQTGTVVKKGPDFDKMMAPRPTNMLELEW